MKRLFFIIPISVVILAFFSFSKPIEVIYIQPLGNVSPAYIELVKKSVKSFYGVNCTLQPKIRITTDVLSKMTKRVDADKLLKKYNSQRNTLIITEYDICHFKNKLKPEFGIFGLGLRPGKTCVISTFRLKKEATHQKTLERLEKVVLHEIGHNLGLAHCTNHKECMMNDANGTIKQVDHEKVWFCGKCREQIKNK
jgi:archaemetzincin